VLIYVGILAQEHILNPRAKKLSVFICVAFCFSLLLDTFSSFNYLSRYISEIRRTRFRSIDQERQRFKDSQYYFRNTEKYFRNYFRRRCGPIWRAVWPQSFRKKILHRKKLFRFGKTLIFFLEYIERSMHKSL